MDVTLRHADDRDRPFVYRLFADPACAPLLPSPELRPHAWLKENRQDTLVLIAEAAGKPLGLVWFTTPDMGASYVTVALLERGQGFGQGVAEATVRYAFVELGLRRLATTVVSGNQAAEKLAERIGRPEGTLREGFMDTSGLVRDVKVYSLLSWEYDAAATAGRK